MVMLLTRKDLRSYGIRYHRNHIDRLIKANKFPRPFKLTPGGWNFWTEDQIVEFVRARADGKPRGCTNMSLLVPAGELG